MAGGRELAAATFCRWEGRGGSQVWGKGQGEVGGVSRWVVTATNHCRWEGREAGGEEGKTCPG